MHPVYAKGADTEKLMSREQNLTVMSFDNITQIKQELYTLSSQFSQQISTNITGVETIKQALLIVKQLINPSKPIDSDYRGVLEKIFKSCYKDANPNLSFSNFKINWQKLATCLNFPTTPFNTNEGIGIFYIIDNSNLANLRPSFVISRALRTTIGGKPTVVPTSYNGTFLMLVYGNDEGTLISQEELETYMNAYQQTTKFQQLDGETNYYAKNYNHPFVTFHEGSKFTNFFFDNFPFGVVSQNLKVSVENGASFPVNIYNITSIPIEACLHTGMFFFEIDGQLLLDNTHEPNLPFKNKGLDVGRLCPPDC